MSIVARKPATRGCHSAMPRTPRGAQEAKRRAGLFAQPGGRTPKDALGRRCSWDRVAGVWRDADGKIAVSRRPARTDRAPSRGYRPAASDALLIDPEHAERAAAQLQAIQNAMQLEQGQGLHASIQRSRERVAEVAAQHIPLSRLLDLID